MNLTPLVLFLLAQLLYLCFFHPLAKYPGPLLARFSNLWRFVTFCSFRHHLIDKDVHDRYGPVVRVGPSSLSFSKLEDSEAIYGFHDDFEKGDWYESIRDPKTQEGNIFGVRSYAAHRERRKLLLGPALSSGKIAAYKPVIIKHVEELIRSISEAQNTTSSEFTNVAQVLHRFTLETLFEIISGESLAYNVAENQGKIANDLHAISFSTFSIVWLPFLRWLLTSQVGRMLTRRPKYNSSGDLLGFSVPVAQIKRSISLATDGGSSIDRPCIVSNLVQTPKESGKRMKDVELEREAINLFFAGPSSTSAALTAIFYFLVKETLRLYPPFPTAFPRETAGPITSAVLPSVQGALPKAITVSCNLYVLGRSQELWGEDAEKTRALDSRRPDEKFLSFGKGPRHCIGKEVAMAMITEAVRAVLAKWTIQSSGRLECKNSFHMQYDLCEVLFDEISD